MSSKLRFTACCRACASSLVVFSSSTETRRPRSTTSSITSLLDCVCNQRLCRSWLRCRPATTVSRRCSGSGDDVDIVPLLKDLVFLEPEPAVRNTLPGLHVVFVAVPWAHEVHVSF